jgi:hypothetical protein
MWSSGLLVEYLLERRNNSHNRAVPKYRTGLVLPVPLRWVKNRIVPVEVVLDTAARLRLQWFLLYNLSQRFRYDVLRIPKLSHTAVRNSSQSTPAWQSPISCEDRLPDNEHAELPLWVPSQELLNCGGPRRQVGHVGERRSTSRGVPASPSNAFSKSQKFVFDRTMRGSWPGGTDEGPHRYTATKTKAIQR